MNCSVDLRNIKWQLVFAGRLQQHMRRCCRSYNCEDDDYDEDDDKSSMMIMMMVMFVEFIFSIVTLIVMMMVVCVEFIFVFDLVYS